MLHLLTLTPLTVSHELTCDSVKELYQSVDATGNSCCDGRLTFGDLTCDNSQVVPPLSVPMSLDVSNYVVVGNSLEAGFIDNALFKTGMENSMPTMLAKQFAKAPGRFPRPFKQALVNDDYGGLAVGGTRIFAQRLVLDPSGPAPAVMEQFLNATLPVSADLILDAKQTELSNFAVPGAKSFHYVAPGYGNLANLAAGTANPFACRLTGNTPDKTMVELAVDRNPTFFSMMSPGANDVLSFSTAGGVNPSDLTPISLFNTSMHTALQALTANGAKGVISNAPDVTSIPFFTTVPYMSIPIPDATTANAVNAAYSSYNSAMDAAVTSGSLTSEEAAKRKIVFASGPNAVVMMDKHLTTLQGLPSIRQATADDLIIITAAGILGTQKNPADPQSTVFGVTEPLEDMYVLSHDEIMLMKGFYDQHNQILEDCAKTYNLAFVDTNSIMQEVVAGTTFDGIPVDGRLILGGMFSLDGVHPTSKGHAYTARRFLAAIDEKYGSNFVASGNVPHAREYATNYDVNGNPYDVWPLLASSSQSSSRRSLSETPVAHFWKHFPDQKLLI